MTWLSRCARGWALAVFAVFLAAGSGIAAPYAAMVVDARSGKVLHSRNADTQLHPASLTKMMTLYVVFDAVRRGEIDLDTPVLVSRNAASEPPSKLYLKAGQRVRLRFLIRASAVKSANDAATAMAEAIAGSEEAFAARMNATARALGMRDTNFKNAHGLTQAGHLSTARDMTTLGRALFYHFPEYYNLFSRRATDAGGTTVYNTNRKLLNAYAGADGIKTGYTRAAGFNLVASAERGSERIIATMFGGTSGAARNARVAELLDLGFARAPSRVAERIPRRPRLSFRQTASGGGALMMAVSPRPQPRPGATAESIAAVAAAASLPVEPPSATVLAADLGIPPPVQREETVAQSASTAGISAAQSRPDALGGARTALLSEPASEPAEALGAAGDAVAKAPAQPAIATAARASEAAVEMVAAVTTRPRGPTPKPRPATVSFSTKNQPTPVSTAADQTVVVSRNGGEAGRWSLRIGTYPSRYEAERILLTAALIEIETLDEAGREVLRQPRGFEARFTGLDRRTAALACERLAARAQTCEPVGP